MNVGEQEKKTHTPHFKGAKGHNYFLLNWCVPPPLIIF